ncbi:uncharacterized protein [Nicotiana tomentosiformis]|uniref:uncharacterized protein n=1 Tax=Nicotiana tomentosiformis TaxID=4098 RepID=UPI00388CAF34
MAPYEALYGRQCHSLVGWFDHGESSLLGIDLVRDALEKVKVIHERLRTALSRQKSYADRRTRDVAYMVGEKVLLSVLLIKGVMRFRKKGKLSPLYSGTFEVLERVGEVDYKLASPPSLSGVHPMYHVSMLRKYYGDPSHVLDINTIQLDEELTYDVEPLAILDRQVQKLRSKNIAPVKVHWRSQPIEKATREIEQEIQSRHPHFFDTPGMFLDSFEDERLSCKAP